MLVTACIHILWFSLPCLFQDPILISKPTISINKYKAIYLQNVPRNEDPDPNKSNCSLLFIQPEIQSNCPRKGYMECS